MAGPELPPPRVGPARLHRRQLPGQARRLPRARLARQVRDGQGRRPRGRRPDRSRRGQGRGAAAGPDRARAHPRGVAHGRPGPRRVVQAPEDGRGHAVRQVQEVPARHDEREPQARLAVLLQVGRPHLLGLCVPPPLPPSRRRVVHLADSLPPSLQRRPRSRPSPRRTATTPTSRRTRRSSSRAARR